MSSGVSYCAADFANLIEAAKSVEDLDTIMRAVYQAFATESLSETEVEQLDSAIRAKRPEHKVASSRIGASKKVGCFAPRKYQRSPNKRASRTRRRTLGGSSALPPSLRGFFSESQRAVLFVIAHEIRKHGSCTCSVAEIAARAGVSRSTAQGAIREAGGMRLLRVIDRPVRGAKNLTNKIKIISEVWLCWTGFKKNTKVNPTEIKDTSERK